MNRFELLPFHKDFLKNFEWYDTKDFIEIFRNDPLFAESWQEQSDNVKALLDTENGEILGILIGSSINRNHCEICFCMGRSFVENYDKNKHEFMLLYLHDLKNYINRISTVVRAGNEKLKKLLEHLGFKKECTMKKFYSGGDDAEVFVILKGED